MKQAIGLVLLLGCIAVIAWCSHRAQPDSQAAFQRIVNDLTLSLRPDRSVTSRYSGISSDHTGAEASWMVQTELTWDDYIARAKKSLGVYEVRTLSDEVVVFSQTTTGDQIIVTLQRIATTPQVLIQVTVVGRPN